MKKDVCLITGGAGFLGRKYCEFFLKKNYVVLCVDNNKKNLKKIPEEHLKKIYSIKPLLRKEIYEYQKNSKKTLEYQKKILIIGGSQVAKFFDDFVAILSPEKSAT